MEHGKLGDRVEGLTTGLVNEDSLVGDRRHHIVLDEIIHETTGTPLIDVRRRHSGRISVLCNEFGFEPVVVACRVVRISGPTMGT
jgi:hypothetical protein